MRLEELGARLEVFGEEWGIAKSKRGSLILIAHMCYVLGVEPMIRAFPIAREMTAEDLGLEAPHET